jgi:hypothetical protein
MQSASASWPGLLITHISLLLTTYNFLEVTLEGKDRAEAQSLGLRPDQ